MSGSAPQPVIPTSRNEMINSWGRVVVSLVVLLLFSAVSSLVLTHTIPSSESATMVVGSVLTMAGAVVTYWIGSSAGSTAKSEQLAAQNPPPPTTTTVKTETAGQPTQQTTTTTGSVPPVSTTTTTGAGTPAEKTVTTTETKP